MLSSSPGDLDSCSKPCVQLDLSQANPQTRSQPPSTLVESHSQTQKKQKLSIEILGASMSDAGQVAINNVVGCQVDNSLVKHSLSAMKPLKWKARARSEFSKAVNVSADDLPKSSKTLSMPLSSDVSLNLPLNPAEIPQIQNLVDLQINPPVEDGDSLSPQEK